MHELKETKETLYRRMWSESQLVGQIKASFNTKGTTEQELDYICDDDLIILDDLGSTVVSDWKKEILLHFVDARYTSEKPTVITTNLDKAEMSQMLGNRIASRVFSAGNTIINFGDIDLRADPEIG